MNKQEALLTRIMDVLAERFNKHAVLRGGMVLRLLGCERLTNDLDYVFVPYHSKKDIVDDVVATLRKMEGVNVSHSLNSKCLRVVVSKEGVSAQIEIKTMMEVATQILSTKELASQYGFPVRLVPVMDYAVALANKMAAWNERRLLRDIYDIWFFLKMGVRPDADTLQSRLRAPAYSRLIKKSDHFQGRTIHDFYAFLNETVQKLTEADVLKELSDYLPPSELPGLDMRFRAEIAKLL
jgi:predicted nucleotidyltransferase component of viral defense system